MANTNRKTVNFTITREDFAHLQKLAAREGVSVSRCVSDIVTAYLIVTAHLRAVPARPPLADEREGDQS